MNKYRFPLIMLIIFNISQIAYSQELPLNLQSIDPLKLQALLQQYNIGVPPTINTPSSIVTQQPQQPPTINTPIDNSQKPNEHIPEVAPKTVKATALTDTIAPSTSNRFGKALFQNRDYKVFKQNTDIVAPENYIIGTGDKINIAIWGYSSYSNMFIVDETGAIFPTNIGKIYLRGLTLSDARSLIKSKFSSSFNFANNEIEVTLSSSRNVTVNLVGDIVEPGSYTMPAYNTLFNMLIAAGGPTDAGSLRNIFVKRNGSTIYTFDTYEFLLNPESKTDYFLQDNDYIFVPAVSRLVEVQGEVLRPFVFELTNLDQLNRLLYFAGGFTSKANSQHLVLKRSTPQGIVFIDVPFDSLLAMKKDFPLQNGDVLIVKPRPTLSKRSITVKGPISFTGEQSYENGEKISDLLKRNPLLDETYLDKAFITRRQSDYTLINIPFSPSTILSDPSSVDNYILANADVINFLSKKDFTDNLTVSIQGAVRNPGTFEYATNLTLSQLLQIAGGLKMDADLQRIEVSRTYEGADQQIKPIPVLIKTIELNNSKLNSADANFQIKPYDMVVVRSISSFSEVLNVTIKGEVRFPGTYSLLDKNERISSIINRAGGLSNYAYAENTLLFRNSESRGKVSLRLDKILAKPGSRKDVILKKGDVIEVTTKSNIVSISGEILYPLSDSTKYVNVPFEAGRRAKYYVKKYGLGFNGFGKRNRTYVVNPGNNIRTCRKYGIFNCYPKVEPGASIVVPPTPGKEQRLEAQRVPVDWNKTIEGITLKVTALATLLIILSRIQF